MPKKVKQRKASPEEIEIGLKLLKFWRSWTNNDSHSISFRDGEYRITFTAVEHFRLSRLIDKVAKLKPQRRSR